jgi:hypothetical protein
MMTWLTCCHLTSELREPKKSCEGAGNRKKDVFRITNPSFSNEIKGLVRFGGSKNRPKTPKKASFSPKISTKSHEPT